MEPCIEVVDMDLDCAADVFVPLAYYPIPDVVCVSTFVDEAIANTWDWQDAFGPVDCYAKDYLRTWKLFF